MAAAAPILIRPAVADDQPAITRLVRTARLNPRDLAWGRFVVADAGGKVVGCAQVRVHGRGARELASVVVAPSHRAAGVGTRLIEAMLAREPGALYLFTASPTVPYFERFGFGRIDGRCAPRDLRAAVRISVLVSPLASLAARRRVRIELMVREPALAASR